jgi:hypothetical protein
MSKLLAKIEPDEIKLLKADTLVRLLHQLLLCEARAMELVSPGILVPYEITVPDGGSDGEWKPKTNNAAFTPNQFIPRNWTRYQCKAEHLTEGKCRSEIAPEDAKGNFNAKARVKEVLQAGGCYAFFSNDHEVKPSNDQDIDTIARDQLQKAGVTPAANAVIEFFGCNRIAEWTNKFPAAVRYVREVTKGFGGVHYFTFGGWTKITDISGTFFVNEAITKKIETIRATLLAGKTRMIRVTGLSGVGKSRLVYEALKQFKDGNVLQDSLSASAIYLRYDDVSSDLPSLINHFADNQYSAIVIIDDCPADIHDRLASVVAKSLLSVVTIFHEPQQPRNDSQLLELTPEDMDGVVESILRADTNLEARGDAAIKAVAAFAEGFPQIAKLIVEFHRAPTMEELNERAKVFRKLLSRGENPDKATLLAAQSLSLFRTIGGSASKLETDLGVIRELFCPDISDVDYRRALESQKKRKIVQQIADTLSLTPRPLCVALAADFLSFFPTGKWKDVMERLKTAGLLSEFCRRIEELEFSDQAEALGKMFLEDGLPFNDAEYLLTGTTGSQIFRALTVLSPSVAMKVVKRALHECPIEALRESKEPRRDLVRSLELLVWEPATFRDAAELLLKLAAAENEGWANNATGAFKQLFNLQLSGTKVPAVERLEVIRTALQSSERATRRVAIDALGAALNFRHFSRMGDMTLGGKRDANFDWRPKSNREALEYWRECFLILRSCILAHGKDEDAAKESLGKNIGVILQTPLLLELESEFKELCAYLGHVWPVVKDQIKTILDIHKNLTDTHKAALHRCKEYLTPPEGDLPSKLRDVVMTPGWHHREEANGSYTDLSREDAEHFAAELAAKNIDLAPFLSQLLVGEQQQAFYFGEVLGKEHARAKELIHEVLRLWPTLDPKTRNASLPSGIMRGLRGDCAFRTETLDRIAAEPTLIDLLVPLTTTFDAVSEADFLRIQKAVIESRLDSSRLLNLIQGRTLQTLSDAFLTQQFLIILNAKPESAQSLFSVLFSHCHREATRFAQFAELFRNLLLAKGLTLGDNHFGWEWHEVAVKLIATTGDVGWLKMLSQYICDTLMQDKTWIGTDYLRNVASKLFEKAPAKTWTPFGHALATGDDFQKYVISEFLGKSGSRFDDTGSPLWNLPADQFRRWVQSNRSIIPLVLASISLYTVEKQSDGQEVFRWHPHALILLSEASNEKELEQALMGNLFSFGSTGSRVPYLEKRIALVRELARFQDPKMTRISHTVEDWLASEIDRTKREELNRNARFQ